MANQTRIRKKAPTRERTTGDSPEQTDAPAENRHTTRDRTELFDELDALLEEIDDLLGENVEEFVASYRQQGGQ